MPLQTSPGVNVSEINLTTIVPTLSSSVGGIAGVFPWGPVGQATLISNENQLVALFGKPTSLNPQTFFTASSFLGYAQALYVVRGANTTNGGANSAFNAVANNSGAVTVANCAVLNSIDYNSYKIGNVASGTTNLDSNAQYVSRYPGLIGNSLQISVCDSATAYSSNVNTMSTNSSVIVANSVFTVNIGANSASLAITANTTVSDAVNFAANVAGLFIIGDIVTVGNSSVGTQNMSITAITQTSNTTVANVNFSFGSTYLGKINYVANSTVNGNTTVSLIPRGWQYMSNFIAPTTSSFVSQYGNTSAVDTLNVVIVDQGGLFTGVQGAILETYSQLSRAYDAQDYSSSSLYYKTVINQNSKYVWFANDRSGAVSNTSINVITSTNSKPYSQRFVAGQDGLSEANVAFSDVATAYDKLADTNIPVSLIMQGMPQGGSTVVNGQTVNNFQLANYLIDTIATIRKDVVVFITPDDAAVTSYLTSIASSLVNWRGAVRDSSYGFIDSGYKYMYDRYNNVYRFVPTNGDIAGLAARTDYTNDPWWSIAGFNRGQIKNIVRLRWNPSKADRDVLYANSINPIVSFTGQGTVLFGDKTSTMKPSAFDRINVRRLFITLEKAIASASQYSLFEFNDTFTRSQFVNLITPFLRDVQSRRGITDFLVVCDGTNNTPQVIDSNQFIGDIYIKPNRSINYIQLNFVAVPTGVQFSTVVGNF
jgi:phage tail sheath protein FI